MDDILNYVADFGFQIWEWFGIEENRNRSTAIATVFGALAILIGTVWMLIKLCFNTATNRNKIGTSTIPENAISLTPEQFAANNAALLIAAETNLKTAHDAEKTQLQQKIEELRKRAAHPEQALAEAKATIAKLEATLTREGNDIGEARMAKAREALEAGDFSIADDIFAEIEARELLAVERTARAAFARGEIAEQEIRWTDAAEHYARAAELHPTYDKLYSALESSLRNGEYVNAIAFGKKLLEIAQTKFGLTHQKYARALNIHAASLTAAGKNNLAEPFYKQAIEITKQTLGENHPDYARGLNNLAGLYQATGKYDLAEPLYLQATEITKQTLGENHPHYATHLNNLALLYRTTGKYDLAEPLSKQAIEIDKHTIGENHPDYATHLNNLALLYNTTGKYDLAEPLYLQAIEIDKQTLGENHPHYAIRLHNLAELYCAIGKYDLAELLYTQAIEIGEQTLGVNHPAYATRLNNLAGLYAATGKYDLAELLCNQAISIFETSLGPDHPSTITVKTNYQDFLKIRP